MKVKYGGVGAPVGLTVFKTAEGSLGAVPGGFDSHTPLPILFEMCVCAVRHNFRKTKNSALILEKIHRIDWQSHPTLSKSSRIDGKKASLPGSRFRNVQVSVDIANNNAMIKKVDITTYIDYNFRGE